MPEAFLVYTVAEAEMESLPILTALLVPVK
jgi:hypothetical protein